LNGLNHQQQQKDQPQRGHSLHKKHKNSTKKSIGDKPSKSIEIIVVK